MRRDFTYFNRLRSASRFFLILSTCLFGIILNTFSVRYYYRDYFNSGSKYKLSPETIRNLAGLEKEVKIFVLLDHSNSDASDLVKNDFERLMTEYVECNPLIEAVFVDPAHESEELRALSNKLGILPSNVIIVQANEQTKVLSIEEFYEIHNGEVIGFRGECLLSSTIEGLMDNDKKNIYFTAGHGEFDIYDISPTTGLSSLSTILSQKNFNVQQLDCSLVDDIPFDADLVVIAGPKVNFLDREISLLKNFLDKRGGSLIVALHGSSDRLLNKFLLDHGICVVPDGQILPLPGASEFSDDLLIRKFGPHEITNKLIELKLPIVFGRTCEVRAAEWESDDFQVMELIQSDGRCKEHDGEYIVGTLFEKSSLNNKVIDGLNGKMLVFGCADFLTNSRINVLGNKILFCRSVDFICGMQLNPNIRMIDIKKYRITLETRKYVGIMIYSALLCCMMFAAGVIVYIIRRK